MRSDASSSRLELLESTAVAAAGGPTLDPEVEVPPYADGLILILDATVVDAAIGDTVDVVVQTELKTIGWVDICHFTQLTGNGAAEKLVAKVARTAPQAMFSDAALAAGQVRNLLGDKVRVSHTVDGASPNFTFSVPAEVT